MSVSMFVVINRKVLTAFAEEIETALVGLLALSLALFLQLASFFTGDGAYHVHRASMQYEVCRHRRRRVGCEERRQLEGVLLGLHKACSIYAYPIGET